MTPPVSPPLWWDPQHLAKAREALANGDPDWVFLESQTRARKSGGEEDGSHGLEPRAVCAWLDGDANAAAEILAQYRSYSEQEPSSNLGDAAWAMSGAILLDILADLVSKADRDATAAVLWMRCHRLHVPTRGNPHIVTNNWWAVTHGGALCAALAATRYGSPDTPGFHADAVPLLLGRIRAFCNHFGPSGLYHEGLGYIRYTCIFLLAAITACKSQGTADLLADFPNLRNLLPSLYAATTARTFVDDDVDALPKSGASLSWNDMGTSAGLSAVDHIGIAIAPEERQPALNAWFHRAFGREAPHPNIGGHHGCVPMAWAFRPVGLPRPQAINLPTDVQDARQGFWIARNQYQDAQDIVFGLYAKHSHAGGHRHEDAGSIRLEAFGTNWIAGPGQARSQKVGQTIMFPVDPQEKTDNLAFLNFQERRPHGLIAGMDMRKTSGAYHERYVACNWQPSAAGPLALALFDQIDDHKNRDWQWTWTFAQHLQAEIDADGRGVVLRDPDTPGSMTAHIRFLLAQPATLEIRELPESKRTYAAGNTVHYRGKPYIHATFAAEPHLPVLAVAAWHANTPMEISGDLFKVTLGGHTWSRPFGAAIPRGFQPGRSPGPSQHAAP